MHLYITTKLILNGLFALKNTNNETVTGKTLQAGLAPINLYLHAQSVAEMIFADFTVSWYWLLMYVFLFPISRSPKFLFSPFWTGVDI